MSASAASSNKVQLGRALPFRSDAEPGPAVRQAWDRLVDALRASEHSKEREPQPLPPPPLKIKNP